MEEERLMVEVEVEVDINIIQLMLLERLFIRSPLVMGVWVIQTLLVPVAMGKTQFLIRSLLTVVVEEVQETRVLMMEITVPMEDREEVGLEQTRDTHTPVEQEVRVIMVEQDHLPGLLVVEAVRVKLVVRRFLMATGVVVALVETELVLNLLYWQWPLLE